MGIFAFLEKLINYPGTIKFRDAGPTTQILSDRPTNSQSLPTVQMDGHNYAHHRRSVQSIKPTVDTRQPPAQPHLSREGKRGSRQRRVSRERQKEIERDNVILLQKMM